MTTLFSLAALVAAPAPAQTASGGFSITRVLAALPTDPASIVAVILLLGSFALVLWFGRSKGDNGDKAA